MNYMMKLIHEYNAQGQNIPEEYTFLRPTLSSVVYGGNLINDLLNLQNTGKMALNHKFAVGNIILRLIVTIISLLV